MKIYTDFHIHTALSPCGDNDMTPNNIVNMALIKGLDAIAITDHNSCENVQVCAEVGKRKGLLVIPGMELQTREDVHAICLFKTVEKALAFQNYIYKRLPQISNNEKVFGEQLVFDAEDNVIRHNYRLLLTSADISFDDAYKIASEYDGKMFPAHIDRDSYSIITSLGFIPDYLGIKVVELYNPNNVYELFNKEILYKGYKHIHSSDAHYLEDILERVNYIEIEKFDLENIFNWF